MTLLSMIGKHSGLFIKNLIDPKILDFRVTNQQMAGITEMQARFWREDGERLEDENKSLLAENEKLKALLKSMTRQRNSYRKELGNMNKQCIGYYNMCSKWNLVEGNDQNWTFVKKR